MRIEIEIGAGELFDKISILRIKDARITDPVRRANVRRELEVLNERAATLPRSDALTALEQRLRDVNESLWDVEDALRDCERRQDFGARFIELARAVYFTNDDRARIKRAVDELLGSRIVEEKSYAAYSNGARPTGPNEG